MVVLFTYILFLLCDLVSPEEFCEYKYKDNANRVQTTYTYCSTSCCGNEFDKDCCESLTGYYIGGAIAGAAIFLLAFGIILCCCKSSSKTVVRRIAVQGPDGQISYINAGTPGSYTRRGDTQHHHHSSIAHNGHNLHLLPGHHDARGTHHHGNRQGRDHSTQHGVHNLPNHIGNNTNEHADSPLANHPYITNITESRGSRRVHRSRNHHPEAAHRNIHFIQDQPPPDYDPPPYKP